MGFVSLQCDVQACEPVGMVVQVFRRNHKRPESTMLEDILCPEYILWAMDGRDQRRVEDGDAKPPHYAARADIHMPDNGVHLQLGIACQAGHAIESLDQCGETER